MDYYNKARLLNLITGSILENLSNPEIKINNKELEDKVKLAHMKWNESQMKDHLKAFLIEELKESLWEMVIESEKALINLKKNSLINSKFYSYTDNII